MLFTQVFFFLTVFDGGAACMCAHLCRLVRRNGKQVVWGGASFVHRRVTSSLGLTCVGTSGALSIAPYSRLNNGDVTTRHNIIIIITREMQFLEIASVVAIIWRLTCLSAHIWRLPIDSS